MAGVTAGTSVADMKLFAQPADGRIVQLDGSVRRVVLDLPELMLVEFTFDQGRKIIQQQVTGGKLLEAGDTQTNR